MKNLIAGALIVTLIAASFAGCNTLRGVGQDVEEGGESIQEVAE
jgi:entericidin B